MGSGDSSSPATAATYTTFIASTTKVQSNDEDEDRDDEVEVQDTADIVDETWVDGQREEGVDHGDQDQSAPTNYLLTELIAINLKSGKTENVLALPGGTKRLLRDMVISIQSVKRMAPKSSGIQDGELSPVLAAYALDGLVHESNYMPLDDDLRYRTFRKGDCDVAKRLAGALIQAG
ncbi:hypothetical protein BGZ96_002742 [Linnemannia gamsii]|uniref:Uncharacterized protein n=1 Tax=Linnemannia gamsii TaxID=64522 RepID=A0ABQ7K8K9_9FUNG|nr:hypothetical protein BGZ96_002742 [Linnemannia gamsii]